MPFDAKKYQRDYQRDWSKRNRQKRNAWKARWRKGVGRAKQSAYIRGWKLKHPAEASAITKRDRDKLRLDVLSAYSGGSPHCACCKEHRLPFLTLDHPAGDGGKERREQGHRGGTAQYRRLRQAGFPPGYRVLCWNCNCATSNGGICPHEAERMTAQMRVEVVRR